MTSTAKSRSTKKLFTATMIALTILILTPKFPVLGVSSTIQYGIEDSFPNLTFSNPVGIYSANDGTNRLFVVQQNGLIVVFNNSKSTPQTLTFLDIQSQVLFSGEEGLLGLAFHPNFTSNKYFYVDYVADNPPRTVIARYTVSANDPNKADNNSELTILEINQPFPNHKGGQIAFGPDGYLYIALGDGGSEGDPLGNAQNLTSLLGKILRIDINSNSTGKNYAIPPDNPFVGNTNGYREEIYAYGLRNPWRFSFDPQTGLLWAGDVGQDRREEIDIIQKGKNYGWNIMEGTLCYTPMSGCNETGLEPPIYDYGHDIGNAIIGGFVYRGPLLHEYLGAYIYGDYGSGRIWALWYGPGIVLTNTELINTGLNITSFGIDQNNNLYFCALNGKIYELSHIPNIENVTQQPAGNEVAPNTIVTVTVTVTDSASTIKKVALNYTVNNFVWTAVPMNDSGGGIYVGGIPGYTYGTNVTYSVIVEDNANNSIDTTELGYTYQYGAVPEFESAFALLILLTTILATVFLKKFIEKHKMMHTNAKSNANLRTQPRIQTWNNVP